MLKLKWHGTAAIELGSDRGKIIFDPFVPIEGSDVDVDIEEFDGFEEIFITHGHFDHIASLPEIVRRNPDVRIYCTESPFKTLIRKGIDKANLVRIGYGEEINVKGFRISIFHGKHAVLPKATPARLKKILEDKNAKNVPHILKEVVQCKESDETAMYLVEAEGKTITLMGSMNLRDGEKYQVETDYLILPYNGWEDNYLPAISVIRALNPGIILLDHYDDTFPPVTSPIDLAPILTRYGERISPLNYEEILL